MTEINNNATPNRNLCDEAADDQSQWIVLLAALPPEIHNRMHAVKLLEDPRWASMEEREQILFTKGARRARRDALRSLVNGVNDKGADAPDWGGTVLRAVAGFDVDMVRELLAAGVQTDQLFRDFEGGLWDIASYALFTFAERARLFQWASSLWAAKCAEIITLSVRAGGTTRVNAWLGAEVAPVLALLESEAITLTGLESWRELGEALGWREAMDGGDAICIMLEERGLLFGDTRAFECEASQVRFDSALDAWFDSMPDDEAAQFRNG